MIVNFSCINIDQHTTLLKSYAEHLVNQLVTYIDSPPHTIDILIKSESTNSFMTILEVPQYLGKDLFIEIHHKDRFKSLELAIKFACERLSFLEQTRCKEVQPVQSENVINFHQHVRRIKDRQKHSKI